MLAKTHHFNDEQEFPKVQNTKTITTRYVFLECFKITTANKPLSELEHLVKSDLHSTGVEHTKPAKYFKLSIFFWYYLDTPYKKAKKHI